MKSVKALAGLVVAGLWASTAMAADVRCPTAAEASTTLNRWLTLSNVPAGVECWDYGTGNETPVDYVNAPGRGDDNLDLGGLGWAAGTGVLLSKNNIGGAQEGLYPGALTVTGGNDTGTFSSLLASTSKLVLVFKFGGGGNPVREPDWMAFVFPANAIIAGDWNLDPNTLLNGLSHVSLYGAEGDEYLVPIPAAAWLLGSGLLGLLAVGRRRRSAVVAAA